MIQIFISILGLAIGSFLNVCIYRIPREDLSIYLPRRSFCPECNESIAIYDNIPLLSYLLLRGKCRHCKAKISALYPIVEFVTTALFLVMYYNFGITLEFLLALVLIVVLIPIFVIDAQHTIIPTVIVWAGLIIGLVIVSAISYQRTDISYLTTRLIGAIAGRVVFWLIAVIGKMVYKEKAMGGGDIELMTFIGLFLGAWPALPMVITLSAFCGAVIGTLLIAIGKKTRKSQIPYGPFIAGAAVIVLLWGDALWEKYLQLAGWN